jgi:hypothetical protein
LTISLSTAGGAVRIGLDGPGVSYDPATGLYTTELAALADGITLSVSAVDAEGTAFGPFVLQLQALDAADDGGAPGEPPAEPSAEAPALIEAPVLAGEPRVGRTLTVSAGTWSGDPVPAITCQWLRNGTPVAGATGEDYRLGAADDRASIACRVTATNSAGSANAETGAVPVVRAAPRAVGTLPDGRGRGRLRRRRTRLLRQRCGRDDRPGHRADHTAHRLGDRGHERGGARAQFRRHG